MAVQATGGIQTLNQEDPIVPLGSRLNREPSIPASVIDMMNENYGGQAEFERAFMQRFNTPFTAAALNNPLVLQFLQTAPGGLVGINDPLPDPVGPVAPVSPTAGGDEETIVEDPEEYLGYSRPYWEADDVKLINRHLEAAIRSGRLDPSYRNRVKFKQRGDEGLFASKLGEPFNFGRSGINKFIGDDVHARTGELIPKDRTATQRGAKDYVTTWLDTVDYSV